MVLAGIAQAAVLALQATLQSDPGGTWTWGGRLAALAPAPFVLYMIWRININPYVSFEKNYFRINNIYTLYLIPYHTITVLEGRTALTLGVSGQRRIPVVAFSAALMGKRQRDAVAEELTKHRDASVEDDGIALQKHTTLGLPEAMGPFLSLALFLAAFLTSLAQ
ncbi:hypothetical protein [Streptomyces sp. NPDC005435]|uniref:hypothetical protein n=1 Tax=Streptomyces sp. NPDC005435 TaxID=3154464 RepID=UPI003454032D